MWRLDCGQLQQLPNTPHMLFGLCLSVRCLTTASATPATPVRSASCGTTSTSPTSTPCIARRWAAAPEGGGGQLLLHETPAGSWRKHYAADPCMHSLPTQGAATCCGRHTSQPTGVFLYCTPHSLPSLAVCLFVSCVLLRRVRTFQSS